MIRAAEVSHERLPARRPRRDFKSAARPDSRLPAEAAVLSLAPSVDARWLPPCSRARDQDRESARAKRNSSLSRAEFEALKLPSSGGSSATWSTDRRTTARIVAERGVDVGRGRYPGDFPLLTKSILMYETSTRSSLHRREMTKARSPNSSPLARPERALSRQIPRDPYFGLLGRGRVLRLLDPRTGRADDGSAASPARPSSASAANRAGSDCAFFGATDGHYAGVTMMSSSRSRACEALVDVGLRVNSRCRK